MDSDLHGHGRWQLLGAIGVFACVLVGRVPVDDLGDEEARESPQPPCGPLRGPLPFSASEEKTIYPIAGLFRWAVLDSNQRPWD